MTSASRMTADDVMAALAALGRTEFGAKLPVAEAAEYLDCYFEARREVLGLAEDLAFLNLGFRDFCFLFPSSAQLLVEDAGAGGGWEPGIAFADFVAQLHDALEGEGEGDPLDRVIEDVQGVRSEGLERIRTKWMYPKMGDFLPILMMHGCRLPDDETGFSDLRRAADELCGMLLSDRAFSARRGQFVSAAVEQYGTGRFDPDHLFRMLSESVEALDGGRLVRTVGSKAFEGDRYGQGAVRDRTAAKMLLALDEEVQRAVDELCRKSTPRPEPFSAKQRRARGEA